MPAPPIVTLRAPAYEVAEQRADGSLVLEPRHERLSDVIRATEGQVFRDEELVTHLVRVAATVDDLRDSARKL